MPPMQWRTFCVDIKISIQFTNLKSVQRKLARLQKLGLTKNWLGGVGELLWYRNQQWHTRQVSPDGKKWQPLSALTKQQRKGKGVLYASGEMLNSLNYQVRKDSLAVGFSDEKAVWHHFGTRPYKIAPDQTSALNIPAIGWRAHADHPGLPARPLLGISNKDERLIYDFLDELVDEYLR